MNTYKANFFLEPSIKKSLLKQARTNSSYKKYVTTTGCPWDLYVSSSSTSGGLILTEEIKYIESIINPSFKINAIVFLKFTKNAYALPHKDGSLLRRSCITWALSPEISNFAPVVYHNSYKEDDVNEVVYYDSYPLILNTQNIHSLKNNNYERISIQICLSNPISELVTADSKNELFIKQ